MNSISSNQALNNILFSRVVIDEDHISAVMYSHLQVITLCCYSNMKILELPNYTKDRMTVTLCVITLSLFVSLLRSSVTHLGLIGRESCYKANPARIPPAGGTRLAALSFQQSLVKQISLQRLRSYCAFNAVIYIKPHQSSVSLCCGGSAGLPSHIGGRYLGLISSVLFLVGP